MDRYLLGFVIAALASTALTVVAREAATRLGWLDVPDSRRKWHPVPIPRIGGVAIYLAMLTTLGVLEGLYALTGAWQPERFAKTGLIVGLSGLVLLIGVWDDLKGMTPHVKLVAQCGVAMLVWALGFRIMEGWTYGSGGLSFGVLSLPVTVLWIVGITNAFNLIDGLDGLAAGTALFATMALVFASIVTGQSDAALLLAVLGGATAGFLRHNFSPASIFLGDSGSLLLGFMLAVVSLQTSQKSATAFAVAVPFLAFGLPVLDTTFVIVRRFLSRQPILRGDRRHIHHALIERGFSPRTAVIVLYGVTGFLGLVSLLFLNPAGKTIGVTFGMLGICVLIGLQQLHIPELRALRVYMWQHLRHQRDLVAGSVAMKQAMDRFDAASSRRELLECLEGALEQSTFSRAVLRLRDTERGSGPGAARSRIGGGTWEWIRADSKHDVPEWQMVFPSCEGTLTLHHREETVYPVSAICWLGQGIAMEFGRALERVEARRRVAPRPAVDRQSAPRTVMACGTATWSAERTDAPASA